MKQEKTWVWEATNGKKFLSYEDAITYSSGITPRKARASVWKTEDGSMFFEYEKAFEHEFSLVD